jgi:phosphate:Na+ symporter
VVETADALRQAQEFMSGMKGPPESEDERRRLTSTLHALDHASRLAETAGEEAELGSASTSPDELRAARLCATAMRSAAFVADEVATPAAIPSATVAGRRTQGSPDAGAASDAPVASIKEALSRLEHCAKALVELRHAHRTTTLSAVPEGTLTAGEAIARVDTMRRLEALAHHAWRAATHLVG